MVKIGVIANPRSRYLRHHPEIVGVLEDLIRGRGRLATTESHADVARIAREFRDAGVDILAIAGGDGTVGITVAGFREVYGDHELPPLALLRGGTMNTVANSLGVPRGRPRQLLGKLIHATRGGRSLETVARSTIDVAGRLGFLFGTGVFRNFLFEYYQRGRGDPSAVTAAATIGHAAISAFLGGTYVSRITAPDELDLIVDGERLGARHYMAVCAGTVTEVGLGFTPFYLADQQHDAFHLLRLYGGPAEVVRELGRVWFGRPLRPRSGDGRAARSVTIEGSEGATIRYMVDGDLYEATGKLELRAGPVVRIVVNP